MKSKKVYVAQIALIAAALALTGCGAMVKKDEDASVIKEKAVQRWDYLIARKAEKAYDFLSPGYRSTVTREKYAKDMNDRGTRWSKVQYLSQTCKTDVCTVHLQVNYTLDLGGLSGKTKASGFSTETWIKDGGQWYYLPEAILPKPGQEGESRKW